MTNFTLKPILSEAWEKVSGIKRYFFVTFLALMGIQLVLVLVQVLIHDYLTTSTAVKVAFNILSLFIFTPLIAGFFYAGGEASQE